MAIQSQATSMERENADLTIQSQIRAVKKENGDLMTIQSQGQWKAKGIWMGITPQTDNM